MSINGDKGWKRDCVYNKFVPKLKKKYLKQDPSIFTTNKFKSYFCSTHVLISTSRQLKTRVTNYIFTEGELNFKNCKLNAEGLQ